jgi:hypothetical protein
MGGKNSTPKIKLFFLNFRFWPRSGKKKNIIALEPYTKPKIL